MSTRLWITFLAGSVLLATGLLLRLGPASEMEAGALEGEGASQVSGDVIDPSMASTSPSRGVEPMKVSALSEEENSVSSLESEFASIEALAAGGDEKAITQLFALMRACSHVLGNEYTGQRSARFEHSAWRPWRLACSPERSLSWSRILSAVPAPSSADIDVFAALPFKTDDPAELAARDRALEGLLSRTDDAEIAASAAWLYVDRSRQLAWANGELPNSLFSPEGSESLRDEVGIAFACRVGRDCSPFAQQTIAECASTAGCLPGASMQQIIEMRRSPQELALIEVLLRRLQEVRAQGG